MIQLSLPNINEHSPYLVEFDKATGLYKFVSEYGVSFSVAFEENDLLLSYGCLFSVFIFEVS